MILAIDYGLNNIGLAISEGEIAEPYKTVHKIEELPAIISSLNIDRIVIGISEGKSKTRALSFGKKLEKMLQLPIEYVDETLSSYEANINKKADKVNEHSRAAAVILQRYLNETIKI